MLDINQIADQQYIPTSVEIKRVVLMYFFVGIMMQLPKDQLTIYEYNHLKQSIGALLVGLLAVCVSAPLWFIPYGTMVIAGVGLIWVGYLCYLIYQAYQGIYPVSGLLMSIGTWILGIFDHTITITRQ